MPAVKQERIAQETLDIYAPLAHRLGMQDLKQQLEDLAFATLHPKRYAEIDHMVATRGRPSASSTSTQVLEEVRERLDRAAASTPRSPAGRSTSGASTRRWSSRAGSSTTSSTWSASGCIVDSVKDCYAALGSIHATWKPVQGRFKDYIAMPKFNLYQSLHTTVVGPQGKPLEVQIRTREMHQRAEFGVAAHWNYKERHAVGDELAWLNRIVDWQQETSDPERVHGRR